MDEIFDRIKSRLRQIRSNKKKLFASLIIIETLGILILVAYLQKPLTVKFLITQPKAYSVLGMNNKSRYVVHSGDYLVGKTIPETKVVTLITPDKIKKPQISDKEGNWRYQMPNDLKEGRYQFSIGYFDASNKLVFFKTHRIRVETNNKVKLFFNKLFKGFPKKAQAQEDLVDIELEPEGESLIQAIADSPPPPPEEDSSLPPPEPVLPEFNVTIFDLGKNSEILDPGSTLTPIIGVYDSNRDAITRDDNMSLDFILESEGQESISLTSVEECINTKPCLKQIPDSVAFGIYQLKAVLTVQAEAGDQVVTSEPEIVSIGVTELVEDPESSQGAVDPNLSNGPCYGETCPNQEGTKVIPLENLYTNNTLFDTSDGTPVNMVADCSQDYCLMPVSAIYSKYNQTDLDLSSIDLSLFEQPEIAGEILECINSTRDQPSSIVSFVDSLSMIADSYSLTPQTYPTANLFVDSLLSKNLLSCSIDDLNPQDYQQYGEETQTFILQDQVEGGFSLVEDNYRSSGYPLIVKTKYQASTPHYVVLAGITDAYVWVLDPLDPNSGGNYALRINKEDFINSYYDGEFFTVLPPGGDYELGLKRLSDELDLDYTQPGVLAEGALYLKERKDDPAVVPIVNATQLDSKNQPIIRSQISREAMAPEEGKTESTPEQAYTNPLFVLGRFLTIPNSYEYIVRFLGDSERYSIPIRNLVIEEDQNVLNVAPEDKLKENRDQFLGVRITPPLISSQQRIKTPNRRPNLTQKLFFDLNRLGVGKVRIVLDEAKRLDVMDLMPMIEQSFTNGYFVVFQYKPGWTLNKQEYRTNLHFLINQLKKMGVQSNQYAIELGNEVNLHTQYFEDCWIHGPVGRRASRKSENLGSEKYESVCRESAERSPENPNGTRTEDRGWCFEGCRELLYESQECTCQRSNFNIQKLPQVDLFTDPAIKNTLGDLYQEDLTDYYDRFSEFLRDSSAVIWEADPNIKLIVGAVSLQGGGETDTPGKIINKQAEIIRQYLDSLAKYNDLSKFDFALHGYNYWDAGGGEGIYYPLEALKNNPKFQQYKGSNCNCVWISEFGIDQRHTEDIYTLIEFIEQAKANKQIINSVYFHEYNGITSDTPGGEHWQFWDNGKKFPLYNLLQYYIYKDKESVWP